MKHAFYFRFYKIFHSEPICNVLASMAYMLYCFLFLIKKLTRKKEIVTMTVDEAETLINTVYPRPYSSPEYINPVIRNDLDLSIVVPVYNYADIIEDTILAILSQKTSYQYEVILVDDGSTDGAGEILKKFESITNVQVIYQANGGIGAARNTGINHAAGKYLMFVDCDDIVHDDIVTGLTATHIILLDAHRRVKRISEILRVHELHCLTVHKVFGGELRSRFHVVTDHCVKKPFCSFSNSFFICVAAGKNHYR